MIYVKISEWLKKRNKYIENLILMFFMEKLGLLVYIKIIFLLLYNF